MPDRPILGAAPRPPSAEPDVVIDLRDPDNPRRIELDPAPPAGAERRPGLQLFVAFNVLNLLDAVLGARREAAPALLEHRSQTPGAMSDARPVFRFDATRPSWTTLRTESAFQLQLGLRYRF